MRPIGMSVLAVIAAMLLEPAVAAADPAVPQANAPCSPAFANAMTWPPNVKLPLVCTGQAGDGYQWNALTQPPAPSDRWLSYGPPMRLHGEGLQNPSVQSGEWTATPQDPNTQCRAEQLAVVKAGVLGEPQIVEGQKGQPLSLRVVPRLFSITMSGYCLWTRAGS